MSNSRSKSSRTRQKSFPEESELAATGYNDPMVARRQERKLVCHRHYDLSHSQEYETVDGIEILSPKQNGSTVDSSGHETPKAHNKASIKGMWKKAFKSLKTDSKGSSKEKEEKVDRQESKYSRMSRQSSLKHLLRRSDSGDSQPQVPRDARHFAGPHSYHEESQTFDKSSRQSSLRKFLRRSESKEMKDGYSQQDSNEKSSRQSSLKRMIRKDSKEKEPASTPSDSELGTCVEEPGEMDPVFATLRTASGLRRPNRGYSETESDHDRQQDFEHEPTSELNPDDYNYDYYDDHSDSASYNMPQASYKSRDFPR